MDRLSVSCVGLANSVIPRRAHVGVPIPAWVFIGKPISAKEKCDGGPFRVKVLLGPPGLIHKEANGAPCMCTMGNPQWVNHRIPS